MTNSRATAWAVGLLAVVMAVGLVLMVYHYGQNVPFFDDWMIVPALTGHQPITLQWLWAQHNDHRMPATNLLVLALFRISGGDFRAGMYFNVAALVLMTSLMLGAALKLRGRIAFADAFIPLTLLGYRHYGNVLWNWQVTFLTPALLAVLAVYLIAQRPVPSRATALGMAVVVCALSLMGAVGPAFAAPFSVWMILAARAVPRECPGTARNLWWGGVLGFCLVGLYFVGYRHSYIQGSADWRGWLRATLEILGLGIGPLEPWPQSMAGLSTRELWGCLAGAILVAGMVFNIVTGLRHREEFIRTSGMALIIAASMILAAIVGWGRHDGYWPRYAILSAPGFLALYTSTLLRPACVVGGLLRGVLLLSALVTAWPNFMEGWHGAEVRRDKLAAFERDLRAGVPPMVLADRYSRLPIVLHRREFESELADNIRMLKNAGVGEFRHAHDDPVFRTIDVSAADDKSYLLKNPAYVYAIRLTYQCLTGSPGSSLAPCRVTWLSAADSMNLQPRAYDFGLHKDGRADHVLVWVNEPISEFQIWPDDSHYKWRMKVQLLIRP